jgi:hypothetical protein
MRVFLKVERYFIYKVGLPYFKISAVNQIKLKLVITILPKICPYNLVFKRVHIAKFTNIITLPFTWDFVFDYDVNSHLRYLRLI